MFAFTSVQIYLFTNEKVVIFVKTSVMREKLLSLMRSEGLTSSRLAELLGIQPSGISHILSGRNKPSFDFVQKILRRFPTINPDWLLLDQGPMYRDTADSAAAANSPATQSVPQLFADTPQNYDTSAPPSDSTPQVIDSMHATTTPPEAVSAVTNGPKHGNVKRIIVLYDDHTFESYNPSK